MSKSPSPRSGILPDRRAPQLPPRPLLYEPLARSDPDPRTSGSGLQSFKAAIPLAVVFFFLVGFFSVCLLRDLVEHLTSVWLARRGGRGGNAPDPRCAARSRGLDPAVLNAFPVRRYSSLKGLREGECVGECAVCLSEFSGDDAVRLLTVCRHAFHRGCIDLWLTTHSTCPVCRSDLEKLLAPEEAVKGPEEGQGSTTGQPNAAHDRQQLQMGGT